VSPKDQLGQYGEAIVEAELSSFFGGKPVLFWPVRLGQKFPTFDFLVKLEGKSSAGAFFFVQVKSTGKLVGRRGRLQSRITSDDVAFALAIPVPSYLLSVAAETKTVYVTAIDAKLGRGVSSVPTTHPFNAASAQLIWDEVRAFWRGVPRSRATSHFSL
jgi:hypothetical protein